MQFNRPTQYAPPAAQQQQQQEGPPCSNCGSPTTAIVSQGKQAGRQFWGCTAKPRCAERVWNGWVDEAPSAKPRSFKRAADEEEPRQIKRANAMSGAEIEAAVGLDMLMSRIDALADQVREYAERTHAFMQAIEAQEQRKGSIH